MTNKIYYKTKSTPTSEQKYCLKLQVYSEGELGPNSYESVKEHPQTKLLGIVKQKLKVTQKFFKEANAYKSIDLI